MATTTIPVTIEADASPPGRDNGLSLHYSRARRSDPG